MATPLDVGDRTQLLLDRVLCGESAGLRRTLHRPAKTGEVLVSPEGDDAPGEPLQIGSYCSVLKEEGTVKLWYFLNHEDKCRRRLCYAFSKDGRHFERPALPPGGHGPANAVIADPIQGGCVWIDPHAPADARYRTQAKWGPPGREGGRAHLHFYASPDGLRWRETHDVPVGDCDTQNVVFWDPAYGRYVMYTRKWVRFEDRNLGHRKVRRLVSDDLVRWEDERTVWEADEAELDMHRTSTGQPPVDYYGACVYRHPGAGNLYICLAQAFWHWKDRPEDEKWGFSPDPDNLDKRVIHLGPSVIDARLGYSRDGIHFERAGDSSAFLGCGPDGAFDSRRVWALPEPVVMGDEIRFYYAGGNRDHDGFVDPAADRRKSGIGCAVLRRDGYASLDAGLDGGWFVTPPLRFQGTRLEINCEASGGGAARVELLDSGRNPIPGFSGDEAEWIWGNSVRLPAKWKTNPDLSSLLGAAVRLKISLRDARIYAFRFCKE